VTFCTALLISSLRLPQSFGSASWRGSVSERPARAVLLAPSHSSRAGRLYRGTVLCACCCSVLRPLILSFRLLSARAWAVTIQAAIVFLPCGRARSVERPFAAIVALYTACGLTGSPVVESTAPWRDDGLRTLGWASSSSMRSADEPALRGYHLLPGCVGRPCAPRAAGGGARRVSSARPSCRTTSERELLCSRAGRLWRNNDGGTSNRPRSILCGRDCRNQFRCPHPPISPRNRALFVPPPTS